MQRVGLRPPDRKRSRGRKGGREEVACGKGGGIARKALLDPVLCPPSGRRGHPKEGLTLLVKQPSGFCF